jgi:DNA-binding NarL/FixJ family response regulator
VICGYVDATSILNKIKNKGKRAVIIYKALGYENWEIALNLGVSERTVSAHIKNIKKILRLLSKKFVSVNTRGNK